MNKKAIFLITILISVSLVGIVITQHFLATRSIKLHESQFEMTVRLTLANVLTQLEMNNKAKLTAEYDSISEPENLNSILLDEINKMLPDSNYYAGIYNKKTGKFIAGNYSKHETQLINSPYQLALNNIFKEKDYFLSLYVKEQHFIINRQIRLWLMVSVAFLIILLLCFAYFILTLIKQRKLSELKADFMNNMTHEFKTPIATTALAAEMILKQEMNGDRNKVNKYAQVILDESKRLQTQVEQVLQLSVMEKGDYQFNYQETSIHQLLQIVLKSFDLRVKEENINFSVRMTAENSMAKVDKFHIMNVFYNLLDNAIKYSPQNPDISLHTWNDENGIYISIKDNGIGIKAEHKELVFKNLFRVQTGNIHDVRGLGMGLYYVKIVIDHHKGKIILESEPGKGSNFIVFLPI